MGKTKSLEEAFAELENNNKPENRLTNLEKSIFNYGNTWQSKEDTTALQKRINSEKMRAVFNSDDELLKKLDKISKDINERSKFYSKYKTVDEYNKMVKNADYSQKYKGYSYQQIKDLLESDGYTTKRRRGLIDESEAEWLKNQRYSLATSAEIQQEIEALGGEEKWLSQKRNAENQRVMSEGEKRHAIKSGTYNSILENSSKLQKEAQANLDQIALLKTILAQKKKQEEFDKNWGSITVDDNYSPKINKEETDRYYRTVNSIPAKDFKDELDDKYLIAPDLKAQLQRLALMEKPERDKYNLIYEEQGIEKANEYADDLVSNVLDARLNQNEMEEFYKFSSENPFLGSVGSVFYSLGSGLEYAQNLLSGQTDKRILSATRAQGLREGAKSQIDSEFWDFVYDTAMSGADSLAAAGLSAVVPFAGEILLGGSAAASTLNNALDRGVSGGDAILSSIAAGTAESLFEHLSIGKLFDIKDLTGGFTKAGIKQAAKKIGTDILVNASEETLTEIANIVTDQLINTDLSSYAIAVKDYYMQGMTIEVARSKAASDLGSQVLTAMASGALMGFGFGAGGSIVGLSSSQIKNSKHGNAIISNQSLDSFKTLAADSGISDIVKDAEKLTEKSKPSQIGAVFNRLVQAKTNEAVKSMETALLENGATKSGSNSAKGWAEQIAKSVFVGKDSPTVANILSNNVTKTVYSEFVKEGKYGGDTLLALKELASNPQPKAMTANDFVNSYGGEGPAVSGEIKGIASAPRTGAIRPITEAYGRSVAERLEEERPNPKTQKELEKKYLADTLQITPEQEQILKDFGKRYGLNIEFEDGLVNGKGYGYFDKEKTIKISRYAKKPMAALFKHEFTHTVEGSKFYEKFQDYLFSGDSAAFNEWLLLKGYANFEDAVNYEMSKYEAHKVDYNKKDSTEDDKKKGNNYKRAKADVVANFVGDYLFGEADEKITTDFLAELKKKDRNLFQRFVEWVNSVLKRLGTLNAVDRDIIKLQQKFKRLAETAKRTDTQSGKGEGEINTTTEKVGVEYDENTNSVHPLYSLASWEDSDYVKDRNKAAQEIANAIGVSKKTAIKYINSINSIAKIIADDRVRLDYDPATGKTSFVSNVEYGGSIDFSTLCQKRKWLTGTFSAIQRILKNSALTASEVLKIRNMLKDKGIEVSCGLCYVEGSRAEMGIYAKEFIERYKKSNPKFIPDMADVNTPEGVEALRVNHPEVYEAYEKFWNNKGVLNEGDSVLFASQRKPKLYSVRTDYKHEILDKFKNEDNVSEKNKNGGLRIQSFSDFEIVHLIDMMQVIMDMSRVGLAGQAYTKVPNFALALGNTGLKINLSLIAKDVDANGNLIFDNIEGMNIDTAMNIRDMYSQNVGTILVVFNDAQLKAALNDSRIDFIIPFHRSQWKRSQYAEIGLPSNTKDYTYMQNERYIKPVYYTTKKGTQGKRKATNYAPNEYWDFTKSGKENAESYLKLCAENNKRPKFYKLLVDNKNGSYSLQPDGSTDGYWKLLIDFKMYDNNGKGSPQTPVKPIFNMEESMRMLNEYEGDHTSFPVDQEVVDTFVKEYKQKHKLDDFTENGLNKVEVKDDYDIGSYSLPDIDADYMNAVESGDMETAQRLVDEAAKKAGYDTRAYHGTGADFNIFSEENVSKRNVWGKGFYFGTSKGIADDYASFRARQGGKYRIVNAYLKMDNPYTPHKSDLGTAEEILNKWFPDMWKNSKELGIGYIQGKLDNSPLDLLQFIAEHNNVEVQDVLKEYGYNSVKDGGEIVVFDSNQIKSADPVTYDDKGNVIPLSQRFNKANDDLRYSLPDVPDIAKGKSNTELRALVDEGKITSDEAFAELSRQFGEMEKGENPKVDVTVPQKVSEKQGVRRFARTALESGHLTEGMSENAKKEMIDGVLNYRIVSDREAVRAAEKKIENDIEAAIKEWESVVNSGKIPTKKDIALAEALMVEAAKDGHENDVALYLTEIAALGTQMGQSIQALSLLKKLSGVGQVQYISRVIAQLNADLERRYGSKYVNKIKLDPSFENILRNSKNPSEIEEIVDDILTNVARQMPSTWLDKFNAWRYLAMLGNTRTHLRNLFGNAVFLPSVRLKDVLSAVAERMFIRNKSKRTKVFKVNKQYRDFAKADFESIKALITKDGKHNPSDVVQERRKIFTSKLFSPVEKLRKFNFDMLEKEDLIFLRSHYVHALGSVLQARGLDVNNLTETELTEIRDIAINEAQKATYRDFSYFANALNKLAHPTKTGGKIDVITKAGGLFVEGALPFKKTPINILKRGIEYSPIGIATSLFNAYSAARSGEYSGAELIDGLAAGMTGTMVLALGMLLQSLGWIVGGLGYDDEDALERMSGAQPYAINFGDFTYTIDWMAPMVLPLMIGAEMQKANEQDENLNLWDALTVIGEPMSELSMLSGINDVIEGIAYSGEDSLGAFGEVSTNLAASYISQYVPTLAGQITRTIDPVRRANFVDKNSAIPANLQKTGQKILGKSIFWSDEKAPYIDAWGRTEESDNVLLRAFENFISPGYTSKIKDDKVNDELAKVYVDTSEGGVIPKRATSSFQVNGETVRLDQASYVQYATDRGQYSRQYIEELMRHPMYSSLTSADKASAISNLYSYANAKAKSNVSDYDYTTVSTYKTAAKLEAAGFSPVSYYIAKVAMSEQNADKNGDGSVSKSEKKSALRKAGFNSNQINTILNINK